MNISCDIHITRAEDWVEDNEPITLAEIERGLVHYQKDFLLIEQGV